MDGPIPRALCCRHSGLVVGFAVPALGVAAAIGLVAYFICALGAHVRVRDRNVGGAITFFSSLPPLWLLSRVPPPLVSPQTESSDLAVFWLVWRRRHVALLAVERLKRRSPSEGGLLPMDERDWLTARLGAAPFLPGGRSPTDARLGGRSEHYTPGGLASTSRPDPEAIENMQAWLTTVVGRVCFDMIRSRRRYREVLGGACPRPLSCSTA